ncbi:hypothetical protein ABZ260_22345 [Streptosporangium sp. NPDC006013]|uniref:hypothetical protein n=1 Tax=Streptosporangium sp. NPDC006013 TaxID=3155596 RepID=UPI0033B60D51
MAERLSIRQLRDHNHLGRRLHVAHFTGEPTIGERHGQPRAVLVSYAWWAERHDQEGQGTLAS